MDRRKEYQREYQRDRVARLKREWFEANGPCAHCGSWEDLQVDHIDPTTKDPSLVPSRSGIWTRSKAFRDRELAKCQALCGPCHRVKSAAEQTGIKAVNHGTLTAYYKHKCRCPLCSHAAREYQRQWRANHPRKAEQ